MDVQLNKVTPRGQRPGYGTMWQFKDLPDLHLVQGMYGGDEWTITQAGDGFFFLHDDQQAISKLAKSVLEQAGDQPYHRKADALHAFTYALGI